MLIRFGYKALQLLSFSDDILVYWDVAVRLAFSLYYLPLWAIVFGIVHSAIESIVYTLIVPAALEVQRTMQQRADRTHSYLTTAGSDGEPAVCRTLFGSQVLDSLVPTFLAPMLSQVVSDLPTPLRLVLESIVVVATLIPYGALAVASCAIGHKVMTVIIEAMVDAFSRLEDGKDYPLVAARLRFVSKNPRRFTIFTVVCLGLYALSFGLITTAAVVEYADRPVDVVLVSGAIISVAIAFMVGTAVYSAPKGLRLFVLGKPVTKKKSITNNITLSNQPVKEGRDHHTPPRAFHVSVPALVVTEPTPSPSATSRMLPHSNPTTTTATPAAAPSTMLGLSLPLFKGIVAPPSEAASVGNPSTVDKEKVETTTEKQLIAPKNGSKQSPTKAQTSSKSSQNSKKGKKQGQTVTGGQQQRQANGKGSAQKVDTTAQKDSSSPVLIGDVYGDDVSNAVANANFASNSTQSSGEAGVWKGGVESEEEEESSFIPPALRPIVSATEQLVGVEEASLLMSEGSFAIGGPSADDIYSGMSENDDVDGYNRDGRRRYHFMLGNAARSNHHATAAPTTNKVDQLGYALQRRRSSACVGIGGGAGGEAAPLGTPAAASAPPSVSAPTLNAGINSPTPFALSSNSQSANTSNNGSLNGQPSSESQANHFHRTNSNAESLRHPKKAIQPIPLANQERRIRRVDRFLPCPSPELVSYITGPWWEGYIDKVRHMGMEGIIIYFIYNAFFGGAGPVAAAPRAVEMMVLLNIPHFILFYALAVTEWSVRSSHSILWLLRHLDQLPSILLVSAPYLLLCTYCTCYFFPAPIPTMTLLFATIQQALSAVEIARWYEVSPQGGGVQWLEHRPPAPPPHVVAAALSAIASRAAARPSRPLFVRPSSMKAAAAKTPASSSFDLTVLDREIQSLVVGVGGGSMVDLAGFAEAQQFAQQHARVLQAGGGGGGAYPPYGMSRQVSNDVSVDPSEGISAMPSSFPPQSNLSRNVTFNDSVFEVGSSQQEGPRSGRTPSPQSPLTGSPPHTDGAMQSPKGRLQPRHLTAASSSTRPDFRFETISADTSPGGSRSEHNTAAFFARGDGDGRDSGHSSLTSPQPTVPFAQYDKGVAGGGGQRLSNVMRPSSAHHQHHLTANRQFSHMQNVSPFLNSSTPFSHMGTPLLGSAAEMASQQLPLASSYPPSSEVIPVHDSYAIMLEDARQRGKCDLGIVGLDTAADIGLMRLYRRGQTLPSRLERRVTNFAQKDLANGNLVIARQSFLSFGLRRALLLQGTNAFSGTRFNNVRRVQKYVTWTVLAIFLLLLLGLTLQSIIPALQPSPMGMAMLSDGTKGVIIDLRVFADGFAAGHERRRQQKMRAQQAIGDWGDAKDKTTNSGGGGGWLSYILGAGTEEAAAAPTATEPSSSQHYMHHPVASHTAPMIATNPKQAAQMLMREEEWLRGSLFAPANHTIGKWWRRGASASSSSGEKALLPTAHSEGDEDEDELPRLCTASFGTNSSVSIFEINLFSLLAYLSTLKEVQLALDFLNANMDTQWTVATSLWANGTFADVSPACWGGEGEGGLSSPPSSSAHSLTEEEKALCEEASRSRVRDWSGFVEFYEPSRGARVIAVRGTDATSVMDLLQDVNLFFDAILYQVLSTVVPFAGFLPASLGSDFIRMTSMTDVLSRRSLWDPSLGDDDDDDDDGGDEVRWKAAGHSDHRAVSDNGEDANKGGGDDNSLSLFGMIRRIRASAGSLSRRRLNGSGKNGGQHHPVEERQQQAAASSHKRHHHHHHHRPSSELVRAASDRDYHLRVMRYVESRMTAMLRAEEEAEAEAEKRRGGVNHAAYPSTPSQAHTTNHHHHQHGHHHYYPARIRDQLVITGHSMGGTVAHIVGAKLKIQSVAFSSPGIALSHKKFGIKDMHSVHSRTFTVASSNDFVPLIGWQGGEVHHVECGNWWAPEKCHMAESMIGLLWHKCPSIRRRFSGIKDIL